MGKGKTPLPLTSLVQGFVMTIKTEGKAPSTIEYLEGNLRCFLWYAQQQEWPDDSYAVDAWKIREFLGYCATARNRWGATGRGSQSSEKPASSGAWRYYRTLRRLFNWAVSEGLIKESPMANIKVARPKEKPVEPYTLEEIRKMTAICDHDFKNGSQFLGARNKALVLLFLDTGLRLAEMASLRLKDVDIDKGRITVLGKGGYQRVVPFHTGAKKVLWRYLLHREERAERFGRAGDWFWLNEEGRKLTREGIDTAVLRLKLRAGVTSAGTVHKLRHTFAVNALRGLKDPFLLQLLLGHKSLEMTRRYTQSLRIEEALEAHAHASPVDRMGLV